MLRGDGNDEERGGTGTAGPRDSAMSSSEYGSEADVDLVPLPLMTSRGRGPRRQLELDFASDRGQQGQQPVPPPGQRQGGFSPPVTVPGRQDVEPGGGFRPASDALPPAAPEVPVCLSPDAWPANELRIELISEALTIEKPRDGDHVRSDPIGAVFQRCMNAFGVKPEYLKLYELREIDLAHAPQTAHIGVMIRGSRFSLRSLELLLAGQMATRGPPLSAANGSGPAGDASAGPSHNGVGDAGLGNRIAAMERELQLLRRQVEDKERLRRQAQQALEQVRSDFEELARRMHQEGSGKAEDNHVERADVLDRVEGFLAKLSMGGAAQP